MPTTFIDPGAMRHELSLQTPAMEADDLGGHTLHWPEIGTVFAHIEPLAASSFFGADQTLEETTHRITIRHRDAIESGMRFAGSARAFAILTIHDPDETGRYLVCRVKETGQ
jgi:SPP1 family predicted phage head-tail adaptor